MVDSRYAWRPLIRLIGLVKLVKVMSSDRNDSQLFFSSAVGTVFGGRFRYVKLASGATAVVRGQIVFWDISVADNLYQVTTSEAGSTPGAELRAGIVLNPNWGAGKYSFIQDCGPTYIKFRGTLTGTPNVGVACYCAAAGAGTDNGLADVLAGSGNTTFSDVGLMQNRYLGSAIEAPTAGGVKLVNLNLMNVRG